jgi:hypothetical protein
MDERKKRVAEPAVESATGAATSSATGDATSNAASDSASNVTCDTIGDSSATAVKVEQPATELTAESATSASGQCHILLREPSLTYSSICHTIA